VRSAIAAIGTAVAAFFAVNMLGVAVAEAPTGTPLRTIGVQGVATVPIGQADNAAAATAVYREGMAGAVADGQSKATFLAGKLSATLGPIQTVVEDGGYISCSGGGESGYAEYEGEQPDFGSAPRQMAVAPAAAQLNQPARATHGAKPKRTKRKRPSAKRAAAVTCRLTAQVSLVYTIN
jgi:hypothetical protein